MTTNALARWHQLVKERDVAGLDSLLDEGVVFFSPVAHTPQAGKGIATRYLAAAFHLFFNETFRYVREVSGSHDAVLEFEVEIDSLAVNGVDMLTWNDAGQLTAFKVMIRPLKAVNLVHQKMAAMLQADPPLAHAPTPQRRDQRTSETTP